MESTGDTSRSGLWRFARLLSISFVSFWFVIGCISWYFVTSPIWIAPFWSAAGTLVFLMGLIAMLGFRASLVGLRFGLLENHHGAATSALLDALPLLVVEWVTYILMAVACSFSLISVLPLYHAIAISAGATFASIFAYVVGRRASFVSIPRFTLGHWFIPVTSRFRGVLSIPTIEIDWAVDDKLAHFEKGLALAVWVSPALVILVVAIASRVA